jgi:uncharacterized protein YegP (UPF0339 family)
VQIVLFRDKRREWRFRVVARNRKVIAQSEGYKRKASALNGVRVLRNSHLFAVVYE